MKVVVTNTELVLYPGPSDRGRLDELIESTTYTVEGARFSQEYAMGVWDGTTKLVRKLGRKGDRYAAPVGLVGDVLDIFPEAEVEDRRRRPSRALSLRLDPKVIPTLRPYQRKALKAALEDCEIETGKGLLRLPTRAGKTVIAGGIIAELGHRALFVVNSEMLLDQTVRFFRKAIERTGTEELEEELVGQYGSGVLEPGWITVASVQSVTQHLGLPLSDPKRKAVDRLLRSVDTVFFDECHHLEGELWRKAMTRADALYKIGLSATIYLDRKGGTAKGTIWLRAATGPVIFSLSPSDLIEEGWLCRPEITFHTAPEPPLDVAGSWQAVYRDGVVENEKRTELVGAIVEKEVRELGARTLVTVKQIKHGKAIAKELERRGLSVAFVTGSTPLSKRNDLVEAVRLREVDVLLGTVFGEAVDLPFLETVVIADGLASKVLTMQRLRNLTPCGSDDRPRLSPMDPAEIVRVHDFADTCHKILRKHTRERLRTYGSHRAFIVRWDRGGAA